MTDKLLKCPFCGGEARCYPSDAFNESGYFEFIVQCSSVDGHALVGNYQTEAEAIVAWNARATGGTLTAEQVRKAVYAHSIHADCADADWQAIADEMNARAERTCRIVGEWESFTQTQDLRFPSCSECGYNFGREERLGDFIRERCEIPNYCPNCGAKVVDA